MDALRHVRYMADYNRWVNRRLYGFAAGMPHAAVTENRGAYFGSILGTLNHLAVADCLWLRRFEASGHWDQLSAATAWLPQPSTLREPLAIDLPSLESIRIRLDDLFVHWGTELIFSDLNRMLTYRNIKGESCHQQVGPLLSHVFNHQTHHRGQVTTLLKQAGVDPGVTDLIASPGFDRFNQAGTQED